MRITTLLFITLLLVDWAAWTAYAKKQPRRLVFPSKAGDIVFNHRAHSKRLNGNCKRCHDGLWPQSAKTPVRSSDGCRICHHAAGEAFEMKGNCARCHSPKNAAGRQVFR